MSGRKFRKLLLLAIVVGIGYWIYKDRPTVAGIVDSVTSPLMGSRAAVKSSERNRVTDDATSAIAEQTEAQIGSLREGMTSSEVRELLGNPDSVEPDPVNRNRYRWNYKRVRRTLVVDEGRVVSIVLR
jgi:SmpA / OmlA family